MIFTKNCNILVDIYLWRGGLMDRVQAMALIIALWIADLLDSVIWIQLPEFIFRYYLDFEVPVGFK